MWFANHHYSSQLLQCSLIDNIFIVLQRFFINFCNNIIINSFK